MPLARKMHSCPIFFREIDFRLNKVRFFKERTWQNQLIQKIAKTAPANYHKLRGQFLQIFGSIDFAKYVLK